MTQMKRTAIAQDTLNSLKAGYYELNNGKRIEILASLQACLSQTKLYAPETLSHITSNILAGSIPFSQTEFEVRNETTLMGAERLAKLREFQAIGVLNFASAKNAGGGFLNGAQAQEESLARSSGLYQSLIRCPEYYEFHRNQKSLLYSDYMIYSPSCPVFRRDEGTLLEVPYCVNFITSPAPNAGAILRNQPEQYDKIPQVLGDRALKLLSLAAYRGCDALILGAWGCGVFRNDPSRVAQIFADLLLPNHPFWGRFRFVLFSVLDSSPDAKIFTEFQKRFQF